MREKFLRALEPPLPRGYPGGRGQGPVRFWGSGPPKKWVFWDFLTDRATGGGDRDIGGGVKFAQEGFVDPLKSPI